MVRFGSSSILVGDDKSYASTQLRAATSPFYASGFQALDQLETGTVITLRRDGLDKNGNRDFDITSLRAYEVPNLLELFGATLIDAPPYFNTDQTFDNVLTNFAVRSTRRTLEPIIDEDGNQASFISCYGSTLEGIDAGTDRIVTLMLPKSYFQHAILIVQRTFSGGD